MLGLALIFVGGGLGSCCRYGLGRLLNQVGGGVAGGGIPWGTLGANVLGCLLIGLLTGWLTRHQPPQREGLMLLLATGFCGGFTTFSTFALEQGLLLRAGHLWPMLGYLALSVVVGFAALWLALWVTLPVQTASS